MTDRDPTVAESAMEAAGIGGWELDIATGGLRWTAVTFRIHELDPATAPPLEGALDFYPPEARPIIEAAVSEGIRAGTPWDLELPFVTARGRRRWVRSCARALWQDGRTTLLFGAFEDITARRELAAREARLSVIATQMTNAVLMLDRDGRTEWVNEAFTRQMGWTIADMVGRFPRERLSGPGTSAATLRDITRHLRAGERYEAELLNYTKDGYARWMAIVISPVRDGSGTINGFISVETDVTARRAAEAKAVAEAAERERAEALLRDVLDTLPTAVTAYDSDERLILANRAYGELFPIAARFAVPGRTLEAVLRMAAEAGQYAEASGDPAAREAWIAAHLSYFRSPSGSPRTLPLADGRFAQVQDRRSATGTLVSVRSDITDLHAAEATARREVAERVRAEALLRDILEALPCAVTAYDADERLVLTNRAFGEMFPAAAAFAVPGRHYEDLVRHAVALGQYPDAGTTPAEQEAWIARHLGRNRAAGTQHTLRLADGRHVQARERRSESGNLVRVRTDTTELVETQALLRDVLDALPCAVLAYDRNERLILLNRAYADMFPIAARNAIMGMRLEEFIRGNAANGQFVDAGSTPEEVDAWVARHVAMHRSPGLARTLALPHGRFVQALDQRSQTGNLVCVRTDTTDLKRAEEGLRLQAERDALTLLGNRPAFLAALDAALARVGRDVDAGGALLLLDIDYFKQINDTLGHDTGDALLVEVAARLSAHLRVGDAAARLGGDEFGIVIPGLTDPQALAMRLDAIHRALSRPVRLAGRRLPVGLSVGATIFPADGTEAAKLLKNADLALYEAKRSGRGRWSAFRPEQATALEQHVRVADALRLALARNQITAALQPKRRLRDGAHAGFEALARWHDGTRWVAPGEFVPVAEDSGLIGALGDAVMKAALMRIRQLRDLGLDPGRVAVNVTGPQLVDPHFKNDTLTALRRHGLRPADLELELTETVLLGRAAERIDPVLREFSQAGITLALDDFGTGYASLAHLSRLPIDSLKIDRSFVEDIGGGGPGAVIARTVISLAHSLEMAAIAEGVETPEQLAFLQAAGCDAAQGYLFARPLLTVAEAAAYLRAPASSASAPAPDLVKVELY